MFLRSLSLSIKYVCTSSGTAELRSSTIHQRLQEQDRKNHEAYIKSGEIFEDRQQAYEKMTKAHEKLLQSCQTYTVSLLIFH